MEKFIEYLENAEKAINLIEHMIKVTFPLIKEKKIIIKMFSEINLATLNLINSILQYEYIYKRINLTKDAKTNLGIFLNKCSLEYSITEQEIKEILEILRIAEKHKKSSMEFTRNEKIIILSENFQTEILTIEKIKQFYSTLKNILQKTKTKFKS